MCVGKQPIGDVIHNPSFWGLAMPDDHLHKMTALDWMPQTKQMIKRNEDKVAALKMEMMNLGSI